MSLEQINEPVVVPTTDNTAIAELPEESRQTRLKKWLVKEFTIDRRMLPVKLMIFMYISGKKKQQKDVQMIQNLFKMQAWVLSFPI